MVIKNCHIIPFQEFYQLVKQHLNEDIWYLIYKLALPKFNLNETCYFYRHYCKNVIVKIVNIVLFNNSDNIYSYEIKILECECRRLKGPLEICKGGKKTW